MRAGAPGDSPLFLSREGKRLGRVQAWRIVKAAAKQAGLSWKVSPHWMRHAHASHAIERGASVPKVQVTLGHGSLQTTMEYVHARPDNRLSSLPRRLFDSHLHAYNPCNSQRYTLMAE